MKISCSGGSQTKGLQSKGPEGVRVQAGADRVGHLPHLRLPGRQRHLLQGCPAGDQVGAGRNTSAIFGKDNYGRVVTIGWGHVATGDIEFMGATKTIEAIYLDLNYFFYCCS